MFETQRFACSASRGRVRATNMHPRKRTPTMAVIDCHHHVWWLDKFPHQFPPSWGTTPLPRLYAGRSQARAAACGIDGTILVQSLDKYDETLHYLDVAEQNDFIRAVVGWVPLADPPACAQALDALKPRKKFVGMRHLIVYEKDPRWLLQPTVQESLDGASPAVASPSRRSPTPRSSMARCSTPRGGCRTSTSCSTISAARRCRRRAGSRGPRRWCKAAAFPEHQRQAVGRRRRRMALEVVDGGNSPLLRPRDAALRTAAASWPAATGRWCC